MKAELQIDLIFVAGHLRKPGRGCGVQKIATYPFTSPVSKIALEPTLLHALTQTGFVNFRSENFYFISLYIN
jgi:hypothetical protein